MRMMSFVVAVLLSLDTGHVVSAPPVVRPFAVIFANGQINPSLIRESRAAFLDVIGEKGSEASSRPTGLLAVYARLLEQHPGYEFCCGNAHFATVNGPYISCRFISIPSVDAFEDYVELVRQQRGSAATIVRDREHSIRIVTPPKNIERDGTNFKYEYKDLHFHYSDGFLCTGGPEIFDLDLSAVKGLAEKAKEHHGAWFIVPQNLTPQTRAYYRDSVLVAIGLAEQRHDHESDASFQIRSATLDSVKLLVSGAFDDVSEVSMTYRLAIGHQPLQCRCQVTVRERSALARFLAGLKTRPPIRRSVRETAPIWLGVSLGLPPEVQLLASSFIRSEVLESSPLQAAMLDKVAEGSLAVEAYFDLDENLEPFLAAEVPMNGASIDMAQGIGPLRSKFPASGDGLAVLPFSTTPDSLHLKDYRLSALIGEGVLKAHLGKGSPSTRSIEHSESPNMMHRLLELSVDLKRIVSSDQDAPVRRLVDAIEKADFEKHVNQHPELATMLFPPVAEYKAFYSKYANDDPLTAWLWLDASSDGTEAVLEFEVSPTLYHLYKARNYMHYGARRKLAGFK